MKRISHPEEAEERKSLMMSPSKPFAAAGSGIPKPTAAVKGTAKISVKKTAAAPEAERTPGDGKEVAKCIHPPSEPSAQADPDPPSYNKSKSCNGNPPENDPSQPEAAEEAADEADSAQVVKMDDQSNGNSHNWVSWK